MNCDIVGVSLMKDIHLNKKANITSVKQAEQNIIELERVVVDQIVKLKGKIDFYSQAEYEGPYRDYVNIEEGETIETQCIQKITETVELLSTLKDIYAGSFVHVYEQVKIDDGVEEALFDDMDLSYKVTDVLKMLYGYIQKSAEVKDYHINFRVRITQNVGCGSICKDIIEIRIEGIKYKGFFVSWDVIDKTEYDYGTGRQLVKFADYFMDRNFNIFSEEEAFNMMNQNVG